MIKHLIIFISSLIIGFIALKLGGKFPGKEEVGRGLSGLRHWLGRYGVRGKGYEGRGERDGVEIFLLLS